MKVISAKDFFCTPVIWTFIVSFIISGTIIMLIAEEYSGKKEVVYKTAILKTIAGQRTPEVFSDKSIRVIADYLKSQNLKGLSVWDTISESADLRSFLEGSDNEILVYQSMANEGTHWGLIYMATDDRWQKLANDYRSAELINGSLNGSLIDIPVFEIQKMPNYFWFLGLVVLPQFTLFFAFIINTIKRQDMPDDPPANWYQANFNNMGTYLTMLLLLPGALPFILTGMGIYFLSGSSKIDKKEKFSTYSLAGSGFIKEQKATLEKLQKGE